jgi:hypothetical protein
MITFHNRRIRSGRMELDVATFIVACCGVGAALGGLLVWYCLTHPLYVYDTCPEFIARKRSCDGFQLTARWSKTPWEREQLLYVLAEADIEVPGHARPRAYGDLPESAPATDRVDCHPLAIYVRGKRAEPPAAERVWVYLPGIPDDVRAISGTAGPESNLTIADFESLERTHLWKETIRPRLIGELVAFCDNYQNKRRDDPGAYPPSIWTRISARSLKQAGRKVSSRGRKGDKSNLECFHHTCRGCHGQARVALRRFSLENTPTTSVGIAPNTLQTT